MHVVLFEGSLWSGLAPLSLSRPVFTLLSGTSSLLAKQVRHLKPSRLTLWVRPAMVDYCQRWVVPTLSVPTQVNVPLDDEPALVISGRTLHFSEYEVPPHQAVSVDEANRVRSAFVQAPGLSPTDAIDRTGRWQALLDLPQMMPQSRTADHAWDLLAWNEEAIVADFVGLPEGQPLPAGPYHVIEPTSLWLGRDVTLQPGCVIDASKGPVVLGNGATVGANAVMQGPCYVGPNATVGPLANVRAGTSIGPGCKVAGEVFNSIFLARSNKAHEGFVGNSYVGEWVNLGAGTTTSNLKNTYDEVSLPLLGTETISGRRFLGSIVGDHTKIAINTRLNTGTYIGYSSMIAASHITPRYVPSFTFLTDRGAEPYRMDKAMEVMAAMMSRRDITFGDADRAMVDYVAQVARELESGQARIEDRG
jgi:UDP-N-acetylglucosamine diphosphorylase/glucosamine-1-phosphate N-acetyltransferase